MRLCVIGKFPPIQGGVSSQTYWCAQALAARGHQLHVITNASEVEPRFRTFMRPEDWGWREQEYAGGGCVRVHGTDPVDAAQRHVPMHNPLVTKLASLAIDAIREHDLEAVFSYYLEPYAVAGHLAAEMTRRPHIVRHAGSDIERLRRHRQLRPLYDHVLRAASRVVTRAPVDRWLTDAGVDEPRLFLSGDYQLPRHLFRPDGPVLDVESLAREVDADEDAKSWTRIPGPLDGPTIGIYGKLGEAKGTFALLRAVHELGRQGHRVNVLLMGRGFPPSEARLEEETRRLGLDGRLYRLPFLPYWRVPEFIRCCNAVCFLEHRFPVAVHGPMVPREVQACGTCLLASAEILDRQPLAGRLVHGLNCFAVREVTDVDELAAAVWAAVSNAERAKAIGRRGALHAEETEALAEFPSNYERLFEDEIASAREGSRQAAPGESADEPFPWTRQAIDALPEDLREQVQAAADAHEGPEWALAAYGALLRLVVEEKLSAGLITEAVRLELRLAGVWSAEPVEERSGGVFRLGTFVVGDTDTDARICKSRPKRVPGLDIEECHFDLQPLVNAYPGPLPSTIQPQRSYWAFTHARRVFRLSDLTARLVLRCDGTRSVSELAEELFPGAGAAASDALVRCVLECVRMGVLTLARSSMDPAPGDAGQARLQPLHAR